MVKKVCLNQFAPLIENFLDMIDVNNVVLLPIIEDVDISFTQEFIQWPMFDRHGLKRRSRRMPKASWLKPRFSEQGLSFFFLKVEQGETLKKIDLLIFWDRRRVRVKGLNRLQFAWEHLPFVTAQSIPHCRLLGRRVVSLDRPIAPLRTSGPTTSAW